MARMGKAEASGRWDGSVKKMRILILVGYIDFRNNVMGDFICAVLFCGYIVSESVSTLQSGVHASQSHIRRAESCGV